MKNILFCILSCLALGLYGQKPYATGILIDSIPISNAPGETFALYLPTEYDNQQLSSVIVVFSPSGKGRQGVEVFENAAETNNYMVVCSNNAKNGPYDRNFAIAERLFSHLFSSFNIKEKGIYLAGFSGGSRLATAIASLSDKIEGVIACGAGFSQVSLPIPSTKKFAYAGICGERDMNYKEMIGVKTYLDKLQFDNTLFTFDGNHQWPPSEHIEKALDWLEMKSVKNGHLQKSKAVIESGYLKNYDFAKAAYENNRPLRAYENFERLQFTYSGFLKLDSIVDRIRDIKKSHSFKSALKARNDAFELEGKLTTVFVDRFNKDYDRPAKANMKWWDREFQKLEKLKENAKNEEADKMLSRFRYKFFALLYERQLFGNKEPSGEQKALCKELIAMVYPKKVID